MGVRCASTGRSFGTAGSGGDGLGVGLLGMGLLSGRTQAVLLALAAGAPEQMQPAVGAAATDVAGVYRDLGLAQPDSRNDAGPRPPSSERDELLLGVPAALLLAPDLLRRTGGNAWVRGFRERRDDEPTRLSALDAVSEAGSTRGIEGDRSWLRMMRE